MSYFQQNKSMALSFGGLPLLPCRVKGLGTPFTSIYGHTGIIYALWCWRWMRNYFLGPVKCWNECGMYPTVWTDHQRQLFMSLSYVKYWQIMFSSSNFIHPGQGNMVSGTGVCLQCSSHFFWLALNPCHGRICLLLKHHRNLLMWSNVKVLAFDLEEKGVNGGLTVLGSQKSQSRHRQRGKNPISKGTARKHFDMRK